MVANHCSTENGYEVKHSITRTDVLCKNWRHLPVGFPLSPFSNFETNSHWEYVRFEVFTAVTMKNAVFWDVMLYSSSKNQRFGGLSVVTRATQRNIAEDAILHSHCHENLKSYMSRAALHLYSGAVQFQTWLGEWFPLVLPTSVVTVP
jgi:hypothetical protein